MDNPDKPDDYRIKIDMTPLKVAMGKLALRHRQNLDEAAKAAGMEPTELYKHLEHSDDDPPTDTVK